MRILYEYLAEHESADKIVRIQKYCNRMVQR